MKPGKTAASPGRPRAFDAEKALDRAIGAFWEKGYEGTSLSDLTRVMKINRPSLYAAFGNKESLFRLALDRYASASTAMIQTALREPTARASVEKLLRQSADILGDSNRPRGCLLVHGALSCGEEADPIRQELISRRAAITALLRKRFEQAKAEGDLPRTSDPASLARFVTAVTQGMSVQAVNGATRTQLQQVVDIALQAWPT